MIAEQPKPLGTADAVRCALAALPASAKELLIACGDTPLITAYVIFVGLIFVVTNTLVDLLYGFINPTVNLTAKG